MTPLDNIHTRSVPVLVIGAGGAGLRAALAAHSLNVDVVVLSKRHNNDAHTVLAAGGINAALGNLDKEDSPSWHFADTFEEGYGLGDPLMVEKLVEDAPRAVLELDEWGCSFAKKGEKLDQRFFGAHRYRRTCYAGDWTGRAIISTLYEKVKEAGIDVLEGKYVSDLLVANGTCYGALAFDTTSGEKTIFLADAVVLAGGGHTRLWRRSSSRRDENYGEAMFLALKAGASLSDMELVQFHPTGLTFPENMAGTLVTEAVRGEGGILYNSKKERFMENYDPVRKELSTRDRVALANYTEIKEGRGTSTNGVYLDISHLPKEEILLKLPRMYRQMIEHQMLDISSTPIEVSPTAHYSMGGVVVRETDTGVPGLFAAGECTSGVHGANRLGGNSLVETLVFGRLAGLAAAKRALGLEVSLRPKKETERAVSSLEGKIKKGDQLARVLQRRLRDVMWEKAGVARNKTGLEEGLSLLEDLSVLAKDVDVRPDAEGWQDLSQLLDLEAGLTTAKATLKGALLRTETRGCHFREDFLKLDPSLTFNFVFKGIGLDVHQKKVPAVPKKYQEFLAAEPVSQEGRLLE